MKLQSWPIDGTSYEDDANEAWDRWTALGFKNEIENAIATLAAQGTDPAIALIARAKKRYVNSLNTFTGFGEIPYTLMLPNSWYDSDNDDGWTTYSSSDYHNEVHVSSSSTSYGASGGFNIGFWHAGGGFDHCDSQQSLDINDSSMDVSFSYCVVDIKRPWMDSTLFSLKNWFLMGDYKKACVSDGTMGQQRATVDPTFFPSVVTWLVLIKDLTISWSTFESDWSKADSVTSGGGSVGWGPFAVQGHYERRSSQEDYTGDRHAQGLTVHGIQLLGYVSMINPLSPGVDSSDYMQKPK